MKQQVRLTVNGTEVTFHVEPRESLAHVLREHLGATGTHVACGVGRCGACTVLLDGDAVRSCLLLAVQAEGREVRTVESLARHDGLHPLQAAFLAMRGLQCGFCTSGVVMTALSYLEQGGSPRRCDIEIALAHHICRCTGYTSIVDAVQVCAAAQAHDEEPS